MVYNVEPARVNLYAVEGDSISLSLCFSYRPLVFATKKIFVETVSPPIGLPYLPNCLRMQVRRKDSHLLKDWYSCVSPAAIIIYGSCCQIQDIGFDQPGFFDYDLEDTTTGGQIVTIMRGTFVVRKQVTI